VSNAFTSRLATRARPLSFQPGICESTLQVSDASSLYTKDMRNAPPLAMFVLLPALLSGCHSHPLTDYRQLDKAGMWSSGLEDLKKLNVSDAEVNQLVALKNSGVSDEVCVQLVSAAHDHQHPFNNAAAAKSLNRAGFTDDQILAIAKHDQLDSLSGDAVMLRLIGLSDATVQLLLQRRMKGLPTLSSAEIGRLKNTELSEREIVSRIENGMTDAQADAEAAAREKAFAHSGTGFVHPRARTHRR
jgi:hypothetical protein